tara:strand:- start:659 stop:919 length:261 start_codon:yes stop_codon:yes gene_type:complete
MNIKKDIREKLIKYLDKKLENNDPYIFNEVVNFIKKDRAEQLILSGVSHRRELFNSFIEWIDYNFDQHEYTTEVKQHVDNYLKTIE